MLGFESYGIELDSSLVRVARDLAAKWESRARFASGSFLPMGWEPRGQDGKNRLGTIGRGPSGYLELGHSLDDFDVVYAFPWMGEEEVMLDLMASYGRSDAHLLIHTPQNETKIYRGGRLT